MGSSSNSPLSPPSELKHIDPHKLDILDQRIRGGDVDERGGVSSSSFTTPTRGGLSVISPVPRNNNNATTRPRSGSAVGDNNVSNLTDGGGLSSCAAVGLERGNSNHGAADAEASHSSCQTVHHANLMPGKKEGGVAGKKSHISISEGSKIMGSSSSGSKKKKTPSKRPVSAIGDRHVTPTNRPKRGDSNLGAGNSSGNGGQRKIRTKNIKTPEDGNGSKLSHHAEAATKVTVAESSISRDGASHNGASSCQKPAASSAGTPAAMGSATDQTSRGGESRDTLYSYFGSSNHNTSSNPSRSQLSSPPALQSKQTSKEKGNQRNLYSFFGNNNKKQAGEKQSQHQQQSSEEDAIMSRGDQSKGAAKDGNGTAGDSALATTSSGAKPASSSESGRAKKKKSSLKGSSSAGSGSSMTDAKVTHSEASLHEIKRLQTNLSSLQKQLDDANARNNSIRNNQTLISANLQRQLKRQTAELEEVKKENTTKMVKAAEVMERLVLEESVREATELRQKLASDGARLGRLVSTRVGGGMVGRSHILESWEDGHAPKSIKLRKNELRKRKEGLERRKEELLLLMSSSGSRSSNMTPMVLNGESTVTSMQSGENSLIAESSNNNNNEAGFMMNNNDPLEQMEANETARMHLDEVKRKEMELDAEERALNIEKRAHVRALKLVANEDSSRFRVKRKLHDRYILMNLLGKGGFSEVWRAFDLQNMSHVAVKIHQLEPSWSDAKKDNYTKHVSREYEIHRDVRHPRIVSLYDVFEIDTDSFATVLECCQGTDLDTLLKDRGRLGERDARAILLQILSGMRYLSTPSADKGREGVGRQGIIHYDLKPGNILFDERGNAKITDFGLSKIVDTPDGGEGDSMELTSQGAGTYWYLPPECFLMDQDVRISNKVDVWSIGVIYYQMLFGRRPFGDGQSQDHILRNQTMLHATEVHFPSKPSITEEGKEFIRDCLTYDQMSRPNMSQICERGYLKLTTL